MDEFLNLSEDFLDLFDESSIVSIAPTFGGDNGYNEGCKKSEAGCGSKKNEAGCSSKKNEAGCGSRKTESMYEFSEEDIDTIADEMDFDFNMDESDDMDMSIDEIKSNYEDFSESALFEYLIEDGADSVDYFL